MNAFKQQCITLRKQDKTLNEIVEITGRSKTSVYFHIKDITLSKKKKQEISGATRRLARQVAASRKGKALRPFNTWTPDRVLFVSHLMFDGEILNKRCVYHNRSQALVMRIQTLLKDVYDYKPTLHTVEASGVTRVMFANVELAEFLHAKSLELQQTILQMPRSHQVEFLRAFFDDEGCMDFSNNTKRIRGYQNDKKVLKLVQQTLATFDIMGKLREPNEVVITGKENLLRFEREINFSSGVCINPNRTNSRWKKGLEKRQLLRMAIESYKT